MTMMDSVDQQRQRPANDPSWEHYATTTLQLLADRSLVVDLTREVPPAALAALVEQGVGPTFGVLTACNPHGRALDDVWNRRLTHLLRIDVASGGRAWVPADGISPDGKHRETGFAVSLPKPDARALACKYGQSAFFWFDGASMWLVGAVVVSDDLRLPV